jgi:hypothetical protein
MTKMLKLTAHMLRQLYDCREMQLQNIPCKQSHFPQTLKGLLKRELITFKNMAVNGKILMMVVLTKKGEAYLKMKDEQKNSPNT